MSGRADSADGDCETSALRLPIMAPDDHAPGNLAPSSFIFIPVEPEVLDRCALLTPRERDVLEVLATGATTNDVADRLGVSIEEVQTHIQNIRRTLHAQSKLESVLIALQAGIIDVPPA